MPSSKIKTTSQHPITNLNTSKKAVVVKDLKHKAKALILTPNRINLQTANKYFKLKDQAAMT
jgi:hypothetical protein